MLNGDGSTRRPLGDSLAWRTASWITAAGVIFAVMAMATGLVGRFAEPVEAVTPVTLTVAIFASVVATAGAVSLVKSRNRDLALLSTAASTLSVAKLALSIFGILVLPLVVVTIVALARRAIGRRGVAVAMAVVAGPAVAVGLATVLVIWVQPPLVECRNNGVVSTSRPWWNSSAGSGTSMGSSLGTNSSWGTVTTPGSTYQYRCDANRLVEFRRTSPVRTAGNCGC